MEEPVGEADGGEVAQDGGGKNEGGDEEVAEEEGDDDEDGGEGQGGDTEKVLLSRGADVDRFGGGAG